MRKLLAGALALALLSVFLVRVHGAVTTQTSPAPAPLQLEPALPPAFARVTEPRAFRLPEDHGPHFDYQTEWWYYTGHLETAQGRSFGFQLTFFRRGLDPGPPPARGLATNQIYFGHVAITDVAEGQHRFEERFSRGADGLAGATGTPFHLWLESWSVEATNADGSSVRLRAKAEGGIFLDLQLDSTKPLAAHGDRGVSPKSDALGNASYYVGYTRMRARGRVGVSAAPEEATGEAWFDHEWSTSALGPQAVGWDWWSLQLSDGREVMFFQIRREDGSLEAASGGTLVEADGSTRRLRRDDVQVTAEGGWRSPETDARYPTRWRLSLPGEGLVLRVDPLLASQEMRTSFIYWEGAVRVEGTSRGVPISGRGYVELTGYARSMQGVF